jgi:hypothetical protein
MSGYALCGLLSLVRGWARQRNEHGLAVVLELGDRLEDVGKRAVVPALFWHLEVNARVPATAKFLDARDIDVEIVQVGI